MPNTMMEGRNEKEMETTERTENEYLQSLQVSEVVRESTSLFQNSRVFFPVVIE